ncbi:NarK/NasA family nitrate transporter [Rhizobium laguerreae]|uniref:NNP family nitrate/nitrite transporter-like MFS transporter n=1 Tax=Rhizobium laguerreae TaxID=1076926 RepID=A0A1S9G830_9HYPH|nr:MULTISPECIES: nitrate/nitrite transporter [Rhizobium]ASR06756.1 NarK/NasA family nitrate transporter [Rhizobium leguminosarum bv. viciae]MBB3163690.1 NNP family nitrate/nitrite transporter-like MFS transporter [Rhizobium laguerreae]MBN9983721.1 NarK/NasA family nitrate transporter [Rhizobium laguerreae]MBY3072301.1 NarK/NasA family nitrate transporter [Rhizobium laguerreae]MBY3083801.1 NarK/NasA family nitrate transporter [Rhizobium laguerreae]
MSVIEKSQPMSAGEPAKALWISTVAFTLCFAVWTIFAIIGIRIKQDLGLNEAEFGLLVGTPVLTGSLVRIVLGIWTGRYGGRLVYTLTMLAAALATFLLSYAQTYTQMLIAGLGVGLAGGSFAVGVAYVSPFFPAEKQGTALGIFGAGNVGAAVTKFAAPFVLIAWGWQAVAEIWAVGLALMAIVFWFTTTDDPAFRLRRERRVATKSFVEEFAPLQNVQVWRFSLYYFFAFGGFVALSLWLPRYLVGVYGFNLETAGMIAAAYSIPGSIFRAFGGVLSDKKGARSVMYTMFAVSAVATLILSLPAADASGTGPAFGITPFIFIVVIFVLGFFMSLGKAAVYKHIPAYYPDNVGAVGGVVGMMGGLGGFILPIAFGLLKDMTGLWSSCFLLLFAIVVISLIWMHLSVKQLSRQGHSAPVAAT